ncbi:hypothetical protein JOC86_001060 [Bacillus pakistanensis]|uniref:Uncharacterized protein n=1 Tax=Rossellomorea pakistanensis TaxID=992288 RepID=A0ABS2N9I7_9BACI|nr:hypothetical protein [Bacillus pakistanensis]
MIGNENIEETLTAFHRANEGPRIKQIKTLIDVDVFQGLFMIYFTLL